MNQEPVTSQPLEDKNGHHGNDGAATNSLPDGLRQLSRAMEVTVKQHIDSVEVIVCCCNRPCRYSVYAEDSDEQFLYIQEVSDCYARQVMGAARGFALKFSDYDMDVIRVVRPQTCTRGCLGTCGTLPTLHIQTPPGTTVATITERRTCCYPAYDIHDTEDKLLYRISPKCCYGSIGNLIQNIEMDIYDEHDEIAAQLFKQTKLNFKECFGQTNNFTVKYLTDLSVIQKVILLGSMFLIDYHNFERQNRCCC